MIYIRRVKRTYSYFYNKTGIYFFESNTDKNVYSYFKAGKFFSKFVLIENKNENKNEDESETLNY